MPIGCGFCGDVWVPVFWCLVVFVVVFCWLYLIGGAFKVVFWRLLALCLFCWLCLTSQDHQILRLPPKSDQPRSPIYALATKKWQAKISLSGKVRTLLNSILYISTLFNSLSLYIYFIMSVHRKFLHWTGFDIYIYIPNFMRHVLYRKAYFKKATDLRYTTLFSDMLHIDVWVYLFNV